MHRKYLAVLIPLLIAGCEPYVALSPQQENLNESTPYTSYTGEHNGVVQSSVPDQVQSEGGGDVSGAGGNLPPATPSSGDGSDPAPAPETGGVDNTPVAGAEEQAPEIAGFSASHGLSGTGGKCYVFGHSLGDAQSRFFRECPDSALFDTDPIGNGVWVSAAFRIGLNSPAGRPAVSAPEPVVPPNTDIVIVGTPPEAPTAPVPDVQPTPTNPTAPDTNGPVVDAGEPLVVLHYDSSRDWDDLHAMIAARIVFNKLGYEPAMAVNGAHSKPLGDNVIPGSTAHLKTMFPAGMDARTDMPAILAKWRVMLSTGRPIMVAEGGPSDHTARVLRTLVGEGYDMSKVSVVQHSHSRQWNERNTNPANMNYVKSVADYITIGNGNVGSHGSANLRHSCPSAQCNAWFNGNPLQPQLNWALGVSGTKVADFSDTVELLYIIGDKETKDMITFRRKYFP